MQLNPVYWLELRTRVREQRLWILVVALVCMMAAVTGIVLATMVGTKWNYSVPNDVGKAISWAMLYLQAGLLALLAPLNTAGKLSQEREQRTIAALLNSPVARAKIVLGKLLGAWTFIAWLAVLPLPCILVASLWGGPDPVTLLLCSAINLFAACTLSSIALGFSGYFGRSLTAYLITAAVLFAWLVVLPLFGMLSLGLGSTLDSTFSTVVSYLCFFHHPFYPLVFFAAYTPDSMNETSFLRLGFCLLVWTLLIIFSFLLSNRGLKKEIF